MGIVIVPTLGTVVLKGGTISKPMCRPNKKIKYNKMLTYILRSIFLEIPHLELMKNAERYEW
jgi:hypothetical protein